MKSSIKRLSMDQTHVYKILNKHFHLLTDMKFVYTTADIIGKLGFIKLVFDSNLYYQQGIYRTPTMIEIFAYNALKMSEKGYLIYEKKG